MYYGVVVGIEDVKRKVVEITVNSRYLESNFVPPVSLSITVELVPGGLFVSLWLVGIGSFELVYCIWSVQNMSRVYKCRIQSYSAWFFLCFSFFSFLIGLERTNHLCLCRRIISINFLHIE